jgi:hypothetical protein
MLGITLILLGNIIFWTATRYAKEYQPDNYDLCSRLMDLGFWVVFLGTVIMLGEMCIW